MKPQLQLVGLEESFIVEKGKEEFLNHTATMNLVSFNVYEKEGTLLFYAHGQDLYSENIPYDEQIQSVVN